MTRRRAALALALALALICAAPPIEASAQTPSAPPGDPLRIALLGTSLTHRGGWDRALAERLAACLGRPVEALNFGGSGRTSRWGLTQVAAVRAAAPDLVAIEFSANDASVLKGFSIAESAENVAAIVAALRAGARPQPEIWLLAMNPMRGPRRWIRPWLDHYYDAYRPLAARVGARFVDLRPNWSALGSQALREAIPDGVHPTPESAARIVAPALAASIASQLGGGACPARAVR